MWNKSLLAPILFSLLVDNIFATVKRIDTECFFDRDNKLVEEFGELGVQNCNIINDANSTSGPDDGCNVSRDPDFELGSEKEQFELSIGEGRNTVTEIIVLNITISNISFHKLRIRHQNLAIKNGEIYWQTIEFKEDQIPARLSVYSSVWESHRTKIQFFAEGKKNKFFKEYHFIPNSTIDSKDDSKIFAYVDTTFRDRVYLHIQPYAGITRYLIKFQPANENMEAFCGPQAVNISINNLPHLQTDFSDNGNYKFCVLPEDKSGTNYTAVSVAPFCMQKSSETEFIQILAFAAIPVSIFFILNVSYILSRKKVLEWLKGRKPGCLLVYSATHDAHIDVMIKLAEYLNECEINAMIDVLDIPYETHKNPSHWCDSAFKEATTVVVVASPKCKDAIVTKTIYKSLDEHAMKLIHENRRYRNKRYLAIQLPYCKESDLHKEASALKLLKIPKDLKILVNKIHHTKYTEVYKTPDEQELIKSIQSANKNILHGDSLSEPKSLKGFTDPIFSTIVGTAIEFDQREGSSSNNIASIPQRSRVDRIAYATDINVLDLLKDGKTS